MCRSNKLVENNQVQQTDEPTKDTNFNPNKTARPTEEEGRERSLAQSKPQTADILGTRAERAKTKRALCSGRRRSFIATVGNPNPKRRAAAIFFNLCKRIKTTNNKQQKDYRLFEGGLLA